jgi:hypothetical protein
MLVLVAPLAGAAQFESIIDAMAIKSSAGQSNNGWDDISRIKGVKWKWPRHEVGDHDFTMTGRAKYGRDKNPNIGETEVIVSGVRTMISSVKISIANESAGIEELGKGKATKIKTSCDDDSFTNTVEFYRFDKSGYKPLYVSYQSSSGASGPGSVGIEVAYLLEDVLGIFQNPCMVLK